MYKMYRALNSLKNANTDLSCSLRGWNEIRFWEPLSNEACVHHILYMSSLDCFKAVGFISLLKKWTEFAVSKALLCMHSFLQLFKQLDPGEQRTEEHFGTNYWQSLHARKTIYSSKGRVMFGALVPFYIL